MNRFRAAAILAASLPFLIAAPWRLEQPSQDPDRLTATKKSTAPFGSWGFDLLGQDKSISPGNDFYSYAGGGWMKRTVLPADRIRVGGFSDLGIQADARVQAILEECASSKGLQDSAKGKIGALYRSFMDESTIEALGAAPLQADLDRVRSISNKADLGELMGLQSSTFYASIFELDIEYDAKNPSRNAVYLNQAGLGLPDRDYYLLPQFSEKKAAYEAYVAQLLQLAGWPEPLTEAKAVVAFETEIAGVSSTREEQRDPATTYHPFTLADLRRSAPAFAWEQILRSADLSAVPKVVVTSAQSLPRIAGIYARSPLETLKAWEAFHTVDAAAPYLSGAFVDANFNFRSNLLRGQPVLADRLERAPAVVNDIFGSAVGVIYTARYLSPKTQVQVAAMVENLKAALHARVEALTWMGPATKAEAERKLASFEVQIGQPKFPRDYAGLTMRDKDLYGNVLRSRAFDWKRRIRGLDQPWDKSAWRFWPQYPTAYNENQQLIFTAAVLQPPFFDEAADPAVNYGALGGVIGHEMTHEFDDQGREVDARGFLRDWWTPEDATHFNERARRLSKQYSAMEPLPGLHIKGDLTLGENIADLGGLTIALAAYKSFLSGKNAPLLDGFTGDQRFFLGWAQVWREKTRDEFLRQQVASNVHSPARERVNGVVRNMDDWYAAFNVKPTQALYVRPEDRVRIW